MRPKVSIRTTRLLLQQRLEESLVARFILWLDLLDNVTHRVVPHNKKALVLSCGRGCVSLCVLGPFAHMQACASPRSAAAPARAPSDARAHDNGRGGCSQRVENDWPCYRRDAATDRLSAPDRSQQGLDTSPAEVRAFTVSSGSAVLLLLSGLAVPCYNCD